MYAVDLDAVDSPVILATNKTEFVRKSKAVCDAVFHPTTPAVLVDDLVRGRRFWVTEEVPESVKPFQHLLPAIGEGVDHIATEEAQ